MSRGVQVDCGSRGISYDLAFDVWTIAELCTAASVGFDNQLRGLIGVAEARQHFVHDLLRTDDFRHFNAHEEIGLEPSMVTPLGFLSPIYTLASSSAIWPVVGIVPERPAFSVDTSEVDRVFSVPLSELLNLENFREQRWWRQTSRRTESDGAFRVHFYRVPGDLVWGATARILTELLTLATEPDEGLYR